VTTAGRRAGGRVHGVRYVRIEPDASSASYPLAAAAIVGGSVHVPGSPTRRCRVTRRFADVLGEMGCWVERRRPRHHGAPRRAAARASTSTWSTCPTWCPRWPWSRRSPTPHPHPWRRLHPRRRRAIGSATSAPSCAAGDRATETDDGLVVEPGPPHGARLAPTTTTGWRWRSACSARVRTGHRDRGPRGRVEELARLLVDARGPGDVMTSAPPRRRRVRRRRDAHVSDCVGPFLERLGGLRGSRSLLHAARSRRSSGWPARPRPS
jgi:hypothetical protein